MLEWSSGFPYFLQFNSNKVTKQGPLEKGMANHFSILALKTL